MFLGGIFVADKVTGYPHSATDCRDAEGRDLELDNKTRAEISSYKWLRMQSNVKAFYHRGDDTFILTSQNGS